MEQSLKEANLFCKFAYWNFLIPVAKYQHVVNWKKNLFYPKALSVECCESNKKQKPNEKLLNLIPYKSLVVLLTSML